MAQRIRVFQLEDYRIIRDGLKFLLLQDTEIEVVGDAATADEFITRAQLIPIDILLLDIYLDGMEDRNTMDGFAVCEYVKQNLPNIKIVAHSVYSDADRVTRIMNLGASAFVSKKAGYDELLKAIKLAAAGKRYICSETSKKLKNTEEFLDGTVNILKGEKDLFSAREKDVLELLGMGFSTKNIAKELFITEKTVETHRKNMVDKAKVKNTAELVAFASSRGFVKH